MREMAEKTKIKVLLADKNENSRKSLRSILEKEKYIEVIAEAMDYQTAVRLTGELKPDIVIIDFAMPDKKGLATIKQIIAVLPDVKVIIVSMHSNSRFVVRMLQAGASGYLLKDSAYEELTKAIRTVVSDKTYISPGIAGISI